MIRTYVRQWPMAMSASNQTSTRLVVLLKPVDKKRLQKLARDEQVSSSEIVRRSLHTYNSDAARSEAEEMEMKAALARMGTELDKALETIRSARTEIAENLSSIRKLQAHRP